MSSKEINISLTESDIRKVIEQVVTGPNKELVAEALFQNLMDSSAQEIGYFIQAYIGNKPVLQYSVKEEVLVAPSNLADWNFDKETMIEKGIIKNDLMKAKIIEATVFSSKAYTVVFDYWHKEEKKLVTYEEGYRISADKIVQLAEEWPE